MITEGNYKAIVAHLITYSEGGSIIWFDVMMAVQAVTKKDIHVNDVEPLLRKLVELKVISELPAGLPTGWPEATRYKLHED